MTKITCRYFYNSRCELELSEIGFLSDSFQQDNVLVRGKVVAGARKATGTFQWTSAVQALSKLILVTAAERGAVLRGGQGSAAASLDFAISKQPLWLLDLFGSDADGICLIRRLLKRENPNQKRRGDVVLSFNESVKLDVQVEGRKSFADIVRRIFLEDINFTIRSQDIFSQRSVKKVVSGLVQDPSFCSVAGAGREQLDALCGSLYPSQRLGFEDTNLLERNLSGDTPLRVAVPISLSGSTALFRYLRDTKNYNIHILDRFVHAIEIVNRICNGDFEELPDLVALASAPAATLLSSKYASEYVPVMLMPNINQKIASNDDALDSGRYLLIEDNPSVHSFYFSELVESGELDRQVISKEHFEADDVFSLMADGDPDLRAILFFPYFNLNNIYNDTKLMTPTCKVRADKECILFAHRRLLDNRHRLRMLEVALRSAWRTLLSSEICVESLASQIADDEGYVDFISSAAGVMSSNY